MASFECGKGKESVLHGREPTRRYRRLHATSIFFAANRPGSSDLKLDATLVVPSRGKRGQRGRRRDGYSSERGASYALCGLLAIRLSASSGRQRNRVQDIGGPYFDDHGERSAMSVDRLVPQWSVYGMICYAKRDAAPRVPQISPQRKWEIPSTSCSAAPVRYDLLEERDRLIDHRLLQ
jgi:hypothetical protein